MNSNSNIQNQKEMKKIYVKSMIVVLLTGFMLTSCDKYLDIEPKQEIISETAINTWDDVQIL